MNQIEIRSEIMTLKIEFGTDNAAFDNEGKESEIGRILREIAEDIENGSKSHSIRDINGNPVGYYELTGGE